MCGRACYKAPQCPVPEDIHMEVSATALYKAAFQSDHVAHLDRTGLLLQLGNLTDSTPTDPARALLRSYKLQGLVVAGSRPQASPELSWTQGPKLGGSFDASVEGGSKLFHELFKPM